MSDTICSKMDPCRSPSCADCVAVAAAAPTLQEVGRALNGAPTCHRCGSICRPVSDGSRAVRCINCRHVEEPTGVPVPPDYDSGYVPHELPHVEPHAFCEPPLRSVERRLRRDLDEAVARARRGGLSLRRVRVGLGGANERLGDDTKGRRP